MSWIGVVGSEFSPFYPSRKAHCLGEFSFWTVESIWLGTRMIRIDSPSKIDSSLSPYWLEDIGEENVAVFPKVGEVKQDIKSNPVMRMLRRSKRYDSKRNRLLGRGNWEILPGHYDFDRHEVVTDPDAWRKIAGPFYFSHLDGYPEAVTRLRRMLDSSAALITAEMKGAHGHLKLLEEYLMKRNLC